jgi:hypothetical protein
MTRFFLAAAVAVALGITAGETAAQDKQDLTAGEQAEGRLTLQTARDLASYGEARGDALALVTAARMMAGVPGKVVAGGSAERSRSAGGMVFDVEGLLKKAEELAKGDPLVTKAAAEVRATATGKEGSICYWEYYCYYNGSCEYAYVCR